MFRKSRREHVVCCINVLFTLAGIYLEGEYELSGVELLQCRALSCLGGFMKNGRWLSISGVLFIALALACSSKPNDSSTAVATTSSNPNQIVGAGSTYVYPVMGKWIEGFQKQRSGVQVYYQSVGSGKGMLQLKNGLIDFGASDAALDDVALKGTVPMLQIPESAGPVCITYNLPSVKQPLKLTPEVLAGIFLGTIQTWQDPKITNSNPGVTFPNTAIAVVHRKEESGTTNIFTTYLSSVSPEWKQKAGTGTKVNWPTGLAGKGTEGVTGVVAGTPGAIGYVELTYALGNHLPVAEVENAAGKFVAPSAESASAAILADEEKIAEDVRSPIVNPPASAPNAYPISGFTFLMIPTDGPDAARRGVLKHFIQYIVSGDGQQMASALHYAALPRSVLEQDQKLLDRMTADGKPLQ
jgi:phosphate transport system substrate-binding protein